MDSVTLPDDVYQSLNEQAEEINKKQPLISKIDDKIGEGLTEEEKAQHVIQKERTKTTLPSQLFRRLQAIGLSLFSDIGNVIKSVASGVESSTKMRKFFSGITTKVVSAYLGVKSFIKNNNILNKIYKVILIIAGLYLIFQDFFGTLTQKIKLGDFDIVESISDLFSQGFNGIIELLQKGYDGAATVITLGVDFFNIIKETVSENTKDLGEKLKQYFIGNTTENPPNVKNNVAFNAILAQDRTYATDREFTPYGFRDRGTQLSDERKLRQELIQPMVKGHEGKVRSLLSRYGIKNTMAIDNDSVRTFVSFVNSIDGKPLDYTTAQSTREAIEFTNKKIHQTIIDGIDNQEAKQRLAELTTEEFYEEAQKALEAFKSGQGRSTEQEALLMALLKKSKDNLTLNTKEVDELLEEINTAQTQLQNAKKISPAVAPSMEESETPFADSILKSVSEFKDKTDEMVQDMEKRIYEPFDDTEHIKASFFTTHKDTMGLLNNLANTFNNKLNQIKVNVDKSLSGVWDKFEVAINKTQEAQSEENILVETEENNDIITDVSIVNIENVEYENALILLCNRAAAIEYYISKSRVSVRNLYNAVSALPD